VEPEEKQAREIADQILALEDPRERGMAVYNLERIGTPAVGALIQALQQESYGIRMGAAEALGKIGDKRATTPLIKCLQEDENDFVRAKAAEALGRIGNQRAIKPLIKALKNKAVRRKAAMALISMGPGHAVKPLLKDLRGKNPETRQAAADALEMLGLWAVEHLLKVLTEEKPSMRLWIAEFIRKFGDWRAIEPLRQAITKETDTPIRTALKKTLAKLEADQE
jgi:HEAT repeat protein